MAQVFTSKGEASLLNFLYEVCKGQGRTSIKAFLTKGRIAVNGQKIKAFDWPLKAGDEVEIIPKGVSIADNMMAKAIDDVEHSGVKVLYEDDHIIVIEKRAGLPTIAPRSGQAGHERNAYSILTDYMHRQKKAGDKASVRVSSSRVFIVHRLDRDTSGLLVFAKDERTKDILQSKWNELVLKRTYIAILPGALSPSDGTVTSWLTENEKSFKMSSSPVDDGGQMAVTHYRTVSKTAHYSKIAFELETGRKNQIRVHAAVDLGHPIVGDEKYGSREKFGGRIALHAAVLSFRNPYGGEVLTFESPLPREFGRLK